MIAQIGLRGARTASIVSSTPTAAAPRRAGSWARALVVAGALVAVAGLPVTIGAPRSAPHGSVAARTVADTRADTGAEPAISEDALAAAIERIPADATYGTRDSRGNGMDTAKIIASPAGGYLAVYGPGDKRQVMLASSADLRGWRYVATLDDHATDPTIVSSGDGGFVTGVEYNPGTGGRVRIAHYPSLDALYAARPDRAYTAAHSLSTCNEGTPNIYRVDPGPGPAESRIVVGFHYQRPAGSGCDYDRQGVGTLTGFRAWSAERRPDLDASVITAEHAVGLPDRSNIGARDPLVDRTGARLPYEIIEAGGTNTSFQNWRVFLYDDRDRRARPLRPATPWRSTAFANPSFTVLAGPAGRRELVVALWIHSRGAGLGEAGELIYHTPLPGPAAAGPEPVAGAGAPPRIVGPTLPPATAAPVAGSDPGACAAPAGMRALIDQDATDEQLPWKRTGPGRVTIYFAAAGISPQWRADMQYGSAQWNRSPCLDTRVVDACPAGANCVTVSVVTTGDDGNFDAVEQGGYTTGGHIEYLDTLSAAQKKNVAVHEMGHAVGLRHRKTTHVLMNGETYDDVFNPDATDYQNLLFDYGRPG